MNFQIAAQGHSFKGAMAYYLHDKRQEGQASHAQTSERVAWTETRNLPTNGAHTATRVMIATASHAAQLKAEAGIANTGRKATKPVLAFSLAWRPDEAEHLDRAEMVKAADDALKVMKLDHLQAVVIAHQDTAHPHVHIVVNRVNPTTGKMENIDPSRARALDRWANDYEHKRGNIVSPNRAKKYEEGDRRKRQYPDPEKRKAAIEEGKRSRAEDADKRTQSAAPLPEVKKGAASTKPPSEVAILKDLTDAQKVRHKAEWPALSKTYAAAKDAIYARYAAQMKAVTEQHKQETRADWRAFFKQQKDEARQVAKMEKTTLGVLSLSLVCAKEQMRTGVEPNRGMLSLTFSNVLSSQRRAATFDAAQERDRLAFAKRLNGQLDQKIEVVKGHRAADLVKVRQTFTNDRAALITKQNAERQNIREAWRQVYSRKGQTQTQQVQNAPPTESADVKNHFNDKAQGLPDAPKAQTEARYVSKPAPAPSPMGEVRTPARSVQNVPVKQEAAKVEPSRPSPSQAWSKAAEPPKPAPAKEPSASQAWSKTAEQSLPTREIKPLPDRSKDRDRDR